MSAEPPKLQNYFENDPPNIFDELNVTHSQLEESSKISAEVRDLWPYPKHPETCPPTVPCVSVENLDDPITEAITLHFPTELSKRRQAQMESITVDDRGIKTLIHEHCYRGALSLSSRLLANYGQGFDQRGKSQVKHSTHSLQLWHTRIAVLMKLNLLDIAKSEAEAFGDLNRVDLFYEHSQPQEFKSKYGSYASFSLRLLLAAELPLRLGRPHEALNNLVKILEITTKIQDFFAKLNKSNESNFWTERRVRVMCAMINCAMHLKNYDLAHQLFDKILTIEDLKPCMRYSVGSARGRTYLLCGDIPNAERTFKHFAPQTYSEKIHAAIDEGLVAVAQNRFEEALVIFQKANELDKENILILNNMAVCYLYTGRMHDAIKIYEKAINMNPHRTINESLLLNCCTLYELESNDSKRKKLDLLKLVSANRADLEVSIESCLKL